MKLSVCIPIYNFDVRELVFDLKREIEGNGIDAEIILIDDASNDSFKTINKELLGEVNHFIFLEKNIGRSRIRNLFLQHTEGDYLLFLDCDGKIIDPDFIKIYTEFLIKNPITDVLYGGRTVVGSIPDQNHLLRWKFAVERENLPVVMRNQKPYLSFQTNNFIIKKEIFSKVQFNAELQNYGYEDLVFAMELKSQHIKIQHLQNPIFNNDLETNDVYLKKVVESVESLAKMLKTDFIQPKLSEIKLVKAYNFLRNKNLISTFLFFFSFSEKIIENKLLSNPPNLKYLDIYKLGLLVKRMK